MKMRLTFSYIMSNLWIVILVLLTNIIIIGLFISYYSNANLGFYLSGTYYDNPEEYVRHFQSQILFDEKLKTFSISDSARSNLKIQNAWLQILDESGTVVYQSNDVTPSNRKALPQLYTPISLIHNYKYANPDTIFAGEIKGNLESYTYLIGFPLKEIQRITFHLNKEYVRTTLVQLGLFLLFFDIVLTFTVGYLFSSRLSNPVSKVIYGIGVLANGETLDLYQENGLYKEVHKQMNHLSNTLKLSEDARIEVERMREEWISHISHDVKTPLASIRGYSELLSNSEYAISRDEMLKYARVIEEKALYIDALISDLNLSSKLNQKKILLNKTPVGLADFIREIVIEVLNEHPESKLSFEIDERLDSPDTPKCLIEPLLFKRMLMNLIYNGLYHNEYKAAVVVTLEYSDNSWQLSVVDDGIGISSDELGKIFTRYYRGKNTAHSVEGTGLGMAIVHDVVIAHGGTIGVTSVPHVETRFDICLPSLNHQMPL